MKTEGLSPSRFAEIMGVQPSSISHILGGRNKPSFDFIEKILLRFPKVNPDWLLLGKGTMYRSTPDPVGSKPTPGTDIGTEPAVSGISETPSSIRPAIPSVVTGQPVSLFDAPEMSTSGESSKNNTSGPMPGITDSENISSAEETDAPTPLRASAKSSGSPKRPAEFVRTAEILAGVPPQEIERIVIFFKDKTFLAYTPGE